MRRDQKTDWLWLVVMAIVTAGSVIYALSKPSDYERCVSRLVGADVSMPKARHSCGVVFGESGERTSEFRGDLQDAPE